MLATALDTLSACLYHTGQHEEAIKAGNESLTLARQAYEKNREEVEESLMEILENQSGLIDMFGSKDEAEKLKQELATLEQSLEVEQSLENHDDR